MVTCHVVEVLMLQAEIVSVWVFVSVGAQVGTQVHMHCDFCPSLRLLWPFVSVSDPCHELSRLYSIPLFLLKIKVSTYMCIVPYVVYMH